MSCWPGRTDTGEKLIANFLNPSVSRPRRARPRRRRWNCSTSLLLSRLAHEPARVFSGGQRKLPELARVMMADPAIILLDEPAAGVNATLLEVIMDSYS